MDFEKQLQHVIQCLSVSSGFSTCTVKSAFELTRKPTVLNHPYAVVFVRGVEAEPVVVGGDGRRFMTEIGIEFYLPASGRGREALSLLTAAARVFFSDKMPAVKMCADPMRWDTTADAFVLPCSFWLEEVI